MDDIDQKLAALPPEWAIVVQNYIKNVYENGRKQGIQESFDKLTELHGKALEKHNYYANAAIEVRKLKKQA